MSDNMLQMLSNVAIIIKCPKNPIKSDNTHTNTYGSNMDDKGSKKEM